jgi:large subunit ribosomal protein L18
MSTKEQIDKIRRREKRRGHVRMNLMGTTERPRMTVFKSNRYMYVQVIDDSQGITLAQASSLEEGMKGTKQSVESGMKIGEVIGARCKENKIEQVVFDRNGYKYHGIVKAIADGARKAGIVF